jgi:hypothetical protein
MVFMMGERLAERKARWRGSRGLAFHIIWVISATTLDPDR